LKRASHILLPAVMALLLAGAGDAVACATCFGRSDSEMARGMNMGIMSLMAVIGLVLAGLVSFFVYVAKRAAAQEAKDAISGGFPDNPEDFSTDQDLA
jgi:hypothetical protein